MPLIAKFTNLFGAKGISIKLILFVLIILVFSYLIWVPLWSQEPDTFDPISLVHEDLPEDTGKNLPEFTPSKGVFTTGTTIHLTRILLEKPGGYLTNDKFSPGILMDNIPSWESGVLIQLQDIVRVINNNFSRTQSQSSANPILAEAEAKFYYNPNSWILLPFESQLQQGVDLLNNYFISLNQYPDSRQQKFFPRTDNLIQWLSVVESRLGSLSQTLSLAGRNESKVDYTRQDSSLLPPEEAISWYEVDDYFYHARGQSYALMHLLIAIREDFSEVLQNREAMPSINQAISFLGQSQQEMHSLVVLKGDDFGHFANHPLILVSHISRANTALLDLRTLMEQ